jgi:diguanylate cyclase (GGDEF)-like protein/PAS domain S-box-containing protein
MSDTPPMDTFEPDRGFLADLAATIPGATYRTRYRPGVEWHYTYVSPGVEELFGIPAAEALADRDALTRCVHPDDRALHRAAVVAAVRSGDPLDLEYRVVTRAGDLRWVHVRAVSRRTEHEVTWTGIMTDVSERKRIETELRASEETYRTLFETVPQGIVYQDRSGFITAANPSAQRILGLTLDQMQGRTSMHPDWRALREDGSDFPGEEHPAMVTLRTGKPVRNVVMGVQTPDGGRVWILVGATPLFRNGELEQVYASFEDITERVLLSRELAREATTDYLTGAANRRSFMKRLGTELERVRRHPELRTALAVIDLDHFKHVNDTYGHGTGDAVLQHLVQVVGATIRPTDLLGRTGGEEFAILLPDTDLAQATALAERIRATVAGTPHAYAHGPVTVTISVGVSVMHPGDAGVDDVLVRADLALYEAKSDGRDAVRVRTPDGDHPS